MADRRLSPDEAEIWAKVTASVRRLAPRPPLLESPSAIAGPSNKSATLPTSRPGREPAPPPGAASKALAADTLDGGWDKKLRRGLVIPDRGVDLHGHNLASAHAALDHALDRAVADGVRVLLVVTGKPPRDPAPHRRGLIRAAIGDWLALSRHAGRIAAVRNAHPRHGGGGALYVILRRARTG